MTNPMASNEDHVAATKHRSLAIERLRMAMTPAHVLTALRRDWPYPKANGLETVDCQLVRVFPRGSTDFVVEYEARLVGADGERTQQLFGEVGAKEPRARHEEAVFSLKKPRRWQLTGGGDGEAIVCLDTLGMVLRMPGLDERLPGLKLVHKPKTFRRALRDTILAPGHTVEDVDAHVLGHRLGKRCTARMRYTTRDEATGLLTSSALIAKMYKRRGDRGGLVFELMQQLRANGFGNGSDVRIPDPLAYLAEWNTILMENAPGGALHDATGDALLGGFAAAGRAIAKLHRCGIEVEQRHSIADEIALLERWVDLVDEIHESMASATAAGMARVREELRAIDDPPASIVHRDFYDKQVLIDRDDTILIDFDTMAMSDPAIDIGNFLAHVELARLQGVPVQADAELQFLAAYEGPADAGFSQRVHAYTRATFLRLSCLYAFWPRWSHVVDGLLKQVET